MNIGGTFSNPEQNLKTVGVSENMVVVDLGCGSGHYTKAAALLVGREGRVYAVDIQQELVRRLTEKAKTEHLVNIEVLHGDIEKVGGSKLGEEIADVTILSNVLFQTEDKKDVITEALRVTRPNARVLVVDWSDSYFGMGPDQTRIVSQEAVEDLFADRAELVSEFDAGDHHYGLIFRKK